MAESQKGTITLDLDFEINQSQGPELPIDVPIEIIRNSVQHRLGKEGPIKVTKVKVVAATLDTEKPEFPAVL